MPNIEFSILLLMNKMVAKKMRDDSQEYKESNLWIVNGTPEELCKEIYASRKLAMQLSGGKYNIEQPLNKSVVRKMYEK